MKKRLTLVYSLVLAVLMISASTLQDTREANHTVTVNPDTDIVLEGKNIVLSVETWERNEVSIYASVDFKGDENDRVIDFLENFEKIVKDNISSFAGELMINMEIDEPNKVQIGSRKAGIVIGYSDDELEITYEIKVPAGNNMSIKNSYQDVQVLGRYTGNVKIDHYSGDLEAGSFETLDLQLKYGTAMIDQIGESNMTLYEQKLRINEIELAEIETKYSRLQFEVAGKLTFDSYETKTEVDALSTLEGTFKYGSLQVGKLSKYANFETYELEMEFEEAKSLELGESKYSELKIGSIENLLMKESYEDELTITTANELKIEGKYVEIEISELIGAFRSNLYEGKVELDNISESREISFDGKYNNISVNTAGTPYTLAADIRYGKVNYDEASTDQYRYIKDGSQLEIKLRPKDQNDVANLSITVAGYEMEVDVN